MDGIFFSSSLLSGSLLILTEGVVVGFKNFARAPNLKNIMIIKTTKNQGSLNSLSTTTTNHHKNF
jgi:hypothetical protein